MRHYVDIYLFSNPDVDLYFLWEKVYRQIHLGFVEMQKTNGKVTIGIALPEYDENTNKLGNTLRLLSKDKATLENFNTKQRLNNLSDYVDITDVCHVPDNVSLFACYHRIQPKSNNARLVRLAKRKSNRDNITFDQALTALEKNKEQQIKAPYIPIKSQSTGEKFFLFIGCIKTTSGTIETDFSTYGLSRKSSVPFFK